MSVPLAQRNVFHEKGKLVLSVAGIAAAFTLILLLLGFREGLYVTLTAYIDHIHADLIVAQSGVQGMFSSSSTIPGNIHDQAVEAAGASEAGHIIVADVIFTRGDVKTPVMLVGYDPSSPFGNPWNIGEGRPVENNREIMLDTWLAQRSGIAVGDTVTLLGNSFEVVGLTQETSSWMSPYVFVSLDAAELNLGLVGLVSYHLLQLAEQTDVSLARKAIEANIDGVVALEPGEIAAADRRVLATVMDTPINVMIGVGVVIGIAVMGLTAFTTVTDQLREYGVLKAIGGNTRYMARLAIGQTTYRGVMGFVLGIGLAYATANLIMVVWPQFNIVIQPLNILQTGMLALGMTLISALLPLLRIHKIDPVMAFKG